MRKITKGIVLFILMVLVVSCMPAQWMNTRVVAADSDIILPVADRKISIGSTSVNLNKVKISDFEQFCEELKQFPLMSRVELCESNLSNAQMEELQNRFPNIKFVWTIVLGNYWKIRTDQVAFSCNKGPGPELVNADVEQLKYCTDMVALDLGHNNITDVSFVKYMPDLRVLILSDNHSLSDISPVAYCTDLVYFEAWVCQVTDLSPLQYLVNLMDINMCYNRCPDISPLLHLPRLERIYMSHCGISKASIDKLRETFPNATVEMSIAYTWDGGWREVPRYFAMRNMYKTNTVSDLFLTDYDRLDYFSKVFNVEFYMNKYPEVVEEIGSDQIDLLYYYLNEGIYEDQQGCEEFHASVYAALHPELQEKCQDDVGAYLREYLYHDSSKV